MLHRLQALDVDVDLGPDLHRAAASGDSSAVQRLIGDGVDVNSQDEVCVLVFDMSNDVTVFYYCTG